MLEEIGPFLPGQRPRAAWLQRMLTALRMCLNLSASPPIRVSITPNGLFLSLSDDANRKFFPVLVKANGGSAGNKTTACTLTYDLYTLNDTGYVTKLNGTTPIGPVCSRARIILAPITAASDGSVGQAYYDTTGAIKLYNCAEIVNQNNC